MESEVLCCPSSVPYQLSDLERITLFLWVWVSVSLSTMEMAITNLRIVGILYVRAGHTWVREGITHHPSGPQITIPIHLMSYRNRGLRLLYG